MATRPNRLQDLIRLSRYAPEDVRAIAVDLAKRAELLRLPDVAALCATAIQDADQARALVVRMAEQQALTKKRVRIPAKARLSKHHLASRAIDARESLYVALLLGLIHTRGPNLARARASLWTPFREVGRQRYARWAEEREAARELARIGNNTVIFDPKRVGPASPVPPLAPLPPMPPDPIEAQPLPEPLPPVERWRLAQPYFRVVPRS